MASGAASVIGLRNRDRKRKRARPQPPKDDFNRRGGLGWLRIEPLAIRYHIIRKPDSVPYESRLQGHQIFCLKMSSTAWFVIFIFVVPVQVSLIQLHFHDSSPFDTHPVSMWTFVFAVLILCIAVGYYIKSRLTGSKFSKNICEKIGYISGFLASTAFVSVLVPPFLQPVVFIIWIFISAMFVDIVRNRVLNAVQKLYHTTKVFVHKIWKPMIGMDKNRETTVPL